MEKLRCKCVKGIDGFTWGKVYDVEFAGRVWWAVNDDGKRVSGASDSFDPIEEPVSEELEEELDKYIKNNFTIDKEQLDKFGIEEKDYMYSMDKSDMLKMIRHFTNNYKVPISDVLEEAAKLCVSDYFCITNEEDWDEHAVNALNIFKIAAQWQKEQMIKDSVDAECDVILLEEGDELQYSVLYPKGKKPFNKGDLAKLIIVKED